MLLMLLHACSIEKFIPEGEQLYTGAQLDLETASDVKEFKDVKTELYNLIEPNPNKQLNII